MAPVTLHQRSDLAAQLGAVALPEGPLHADAIDADALGQTSVPGVIAAGDVSTMPSVANAIAAGSNAAASVVRQQVEAALRTAG